MFLTDKSGTLSILEDWYLVQSKPQVRGPQNLFGFQSMPKSVWDSGWLLRCLAINCQIWTSNMENRLHRCAFARTQSWCCGEGVWRSWIPLWTRQEECWASGAGSELGKSLQEAKYLCNPDLNLALWTTQHWGWPSGYTTTEAPEQFHLLWEGSQWVEMGKKSCKFSLLTARSYSSGSAFSSVQSRETETVPWTPSRSEQSSKMSSPFWEPSPC